MLYSGKLIEAEREMLANFLGDESTDRGVTEAKAIPFPRHRGNAEEMTDHHRIRPRMGDPEDPSTGLGNIPKR